MSENENAFLSESASESLKKDLSGIQLGHPSTGIASSAAVKTIEEAFGKVQERYDELAGRVKALEVERTKKGRDGRGI